MKGFKKYLIIVLAVISQCSYAAWEKHTNSLTATQIANGVTLPIFDPRLSDMISDPSGYTNTFWNEQALAKVRLFFEDNDYEYFSQDWSLKIEYQLDLYDATGAVTTVFRDIEVDYDMAGDYLDKAIQLEKGYYGMELRINNISSVGIAAIPGSVHLDVELEIERYYVLNTVTQPLMQIAGSPNVNAVYGFGNATSWNKLPLAWNVISGAESYDLEWLFVDYADAAAASSLSGLSGSQLPLPGTAISVSDLDIDFRKATRVNIVENNYTVSLAYPRGFVLYRVRAVGVDPQNGNRLEGAWSAEATNAQLSSSASYPERVIAYAGIEKKKNWQYTVAYAEDGKRKELMSYYDGALYSRQNVTVVNSEENAIVGQKIYDKQGRSALSVLPSPTDDDELTYHENFVMATSTDIYDAGNFDTTSSIESPNTIWDQAGPGKYYSPNNTIGTVNKELVPDAEGYPFSRTIYSHDGLNRPVKVAGLGSELKITASNERTSQYYYGRPAGAEELDRVFGNEVGTTGYKKQMASDQNGQVSVSYLNINDRVIATAVAKDQASATENLIGLNSADYRSGPDQIITSDLLDGNNELHGDYLISMTPITVDLQQTVNFHYDAGSDLSFNVALCNGDSLFSPAREYEFSVYIGIRDEDNNYIDLSGSGFGSYLVTVASGQEYIEIPYSSSDQDFDFSAVLEPGKTYYIEKRLGLDADLYNEFYNAFSSAFASNNCSLNDFDLVNDQFGDNFDWTSPVMICGAVMECMSAQGYTPIYSLQGAITHYVDAQGTIISLTSAAHDNCVDEDIADEGLTAMSEFPNACEIEKTNIISAMSPGGMYYDNTAASGTPNYDDLDWLTSNYASHDDTELALSGNYNKVFLYNFIFPNASTPIAGTTIANWANFKLAMESYTIDGTFGSAIGSNLNWDDSYWEILMMDLHPEYQVYDCKCVDEQIEGLGPISGAIYNRISEFSDFYAAFYQTNDDQTAITQGYFNPFGSNGTIVIPGVEWDPLNSSYTPPSNPNNAVSKNVSFIQSLGLCGTNLNRVDSFLMGGTEIPGGIRQPLPRDMLFDSLYHDMTNYITVNSNSYSVWDIVYTAFYLDGTFSNPNYAIPNVDITASTELNQLLGTGGLLLASGPISKIEYFRSKYYFFREYHWYAYVKSCAGSPFYHSYDALAPYSVVYPENEIYEMYSSGNLSGLALLDEELQCNIVAEGWADALISQMQLNTNPIFDEFNNYYALSQLASPTGNFTSLYNDIVALELDLIAILQAEECDPSNPSLSSYFTGAVYNNLDVMLVYDSGSTSSFKVCENGNTNNCFSMAYFDYSLSTAPNPASAEASDEYSVAECGCTNFNDYLTNNGLSPTDHAGISSQLISNNYIASSTDYYPEWVTYCAMSNPLFLYLDISNFPMDFYCVDEATILSLSQESVSCGNSFEQTISSYEQNVQTAQDLMVWNYISGYLSFGNEAINEHFSLEYENNLLHYTLYYYDQAGNLIKTVPPKGTSHITNFAAVDDYRNDYSGNIVHPTHDYITNYQYNSLNNITEQSTPDGGTSKFWYDELGRLILSQNAKQEVEGAYSYTLYDALGRIVEVGKVSGVTLDEDLDLNTAMITQASNTDAFDNLFHFWLNVGELSEITRTWYDESISVPVTGLFQPVADLVLGQKNLRMRVASSTYFEGPMDGGLKDGGYTIQDYRTAVDQNNWGALVNDLSDRDPNDYISASHYSYDLHGNVERLVQEKLDPVSSERISKHMRYEYDLVSGNVNMLHYQEGKLDDYHHRYVYDADNRLTEAETSRDGVIWENQAKYYYYAHGPLARVEVGEKQVQGQDYAYTLQGWLKSVNSGSLSASDDPGQDARDNIGNLHKAFAKDMFGYNLHYFNNDYKANGGDQDFIVDFDRNNMGSSPSTTMSLNQFGSLYNGNIAQMVTALPDAGTQGTAYTYDVLNRIMTMDVFEANATTLSNHDKLDQADNTTKANHTLYSYDPDGNITKLRRWDNQASLIDNLTYRYYNSTNISGTYVNTDGQTVNYTDKNTNRLAWFVDTGNSQTADINSTGFSGNQAMYDYDELGNLIQDDLEEIAEIKWTLSGKIKEIIRELGSIKPDLVFAYDPMGNRISKTVKPRDVSGVKDIDEWTTTHYVLDAQRNVMSTYIDSYEEYNSSGLFNITSDLGDNSLYGSDRLGLDAGNVWGKQNLFWHDDPATGGNAVQPPMSLASAQALLPGYYRLEPSVTYLLQGGINTQTIVATFEQDVQLSQTQVMVNNLSPVGGYYQLNANEAYTIHFGNSTNVDMPVVNVHIAVPSGSNVVQAAINSGFIFSRVDFYRLDNMAAAYDSKAFTLSERKLGKKTYEFKNHLGNVLLTTSDRKLPDNVSASIVNTYKADMRSYSDYYPFGMQMLGRNANPGIYRYGYQGSEMDNEVKGDGNQYTTYFRQYDPRLGRWFSPDPKTYMFSFESPYVVNHNNPILYVDSQGDNPFLIALGAFAVGAVIEVGSQAVSIAIENLEEGGGMFDGMLSKIDLWDVGVAGVEAGMIVMTGGTSELWAPAVAGGLKASVDIKGENGFKPVAILFTEKQKDMTEFKGDLAAEAAGLGMDLVPFAKAGTDIVEQVIGKEGKVKNYIAKKGGEAIEEAWHGIVEPQVKSLTESLLKGDSTNDGSADELLDLETLDNPSGDYGVSPSTHGSEYRREGMMPNSFRRRMSRMSRKSMKRYGLEKENRVKLKQY